MEEKIWGTYLLHLASLLLVQVHSSLSVMASHKVIFYYRAIVMKQLGIGKKKTDRQTN